MVKVGLDTTARTSPVWASASRPNSTSTDGRKCCSTPYTYGLLYLYLKLAPTVFVWICNITRGMCCLIFLYDRNQFRATVSQCDQLSQWALTFRLKLNESVEAFWQTLVLVSPSQSPTEFIPN